MKNKEVFFVTSLLFIILLIINIISAQQQAISALSQELTCRINFNIGVLTSMINLTSNASSNLQQSITTLQNDLSKIQSLSNNTDVQNFVKNQYQGDMRNIVSSAQSWRKDRKELTLDQRASLITSYNQLKSTYDQCEQQASQNLLQQRIQNYQMQLSVFQNKTNDFAARGFNVTQLNQLLQNAQTQIIQPLQNALSSSNGSNQSAQMVLKSYCLYDGCVNGTNFHLDANFDITRLNIILADLQTNAAVFNLNNSTLSQIQQDLSNAQSTLNIVGTSAYQSGQNQTIFNNLKDAAKLIAQSITQALKQPIGGLK